MPQNLFSEEEEKQEQFTRNYLTPKEREHLERELYDMGLLPHAYFTWEEAEKEKALQRLYERESEAELPRHLFEDDGEQTAWEDVFQLSSMSVGEKGRLLEGLWRQGLLPQDFNQKTAQEKNKLIRQLYEQGKLKSYLDQKVDQSGTMGDILNGAMDLLFDLSDTNENYAQKFLRGDILGAALNLVGATLRAPKTLVLNLSGLIDSLVSKSEFTWQHDMTYRDYLTKMGKNNGVKTIMDDLDELREMGWAGEIFAGVIEITLETASDPLAVLGAFFKQLGVNTPGSLQYTQKLQNGGFVGKTVERLSDSKKGAEGTVKFSEMTPDEAMKVAQEYKREAPIEIPENATIKASSKKGYEQITYKWRDATYKYEVRWHTRTPGAPGNQENTWVIKCELPGHGRQSPQTYFKVGNTGTDADWVPGFEWYDAIRARQNGTATAEQIKLLDMGHWKEK